MPLSQGQKEFITGAIGHLIDFPNTREELIACAKRIAGCLSQNNLELSGEYQSLCNCILNPTDTLRRLEDYNENNEKLTVGEVKNHLLTLITQEFNSICKSLNLSLADLEWNQEAIADTFTSDPAFGSEFVSQRNRTEDQLPRWQNIRFENSIFQAALFRNENSSTIRLEIKLALPHETRNETIEDFVQTPIDIADEEAAMYALIPSASIEAANRAIDFLKYYLTRRRLFTSEQIRKLTETQTIRPLLLDGFYVILLLRNPHWVDLYLKLTPTQVNILRQPHAKPVLLNQLCNFEELLQYSITEIQLIVIYSGEIKNKLLTIDKFKKLSDVQAKTLSLPVVSNAIKSQKLSFDKALQFPAHVHAVFTSDLYADFFTKRNIDWSVFAVMKAHHQPFLLKPQIALLLKDNALSFNYVLLFTQTQCTTFSDPKVITLLAKNIVRSAHLLRADAETTHLFTSNTQIYEALLLNVVSLQDVILNVELQRDRVVSMRDINDIYIKIFIKRLKLILDDQPLRHTKITGDTTDMISEGRDCITILVLDYLSALIHKNVDNQYIHTQLLREFVTTIQLKLAELTLQNAKTGQFSHQRTLLKALHDSYHPAHNPYQRAVGLLAAAQEMLTRLEMPAPSGPTLFQPTAGANTEQAKKLCKLITECESLIRADEELTLDDAMPLPDQNTGKVMHI